MTKSTSNSGQDGTAFVLQEAILPVLDNNVCNKTINKEMKSVSVFDFLLVLSGTVLLVFETVLPPGFTQRCLY